MKKISLFIGIVMMLLVGCSKIEDCSKIGSYENLSYENLTTVPLYRCHIMCMVTLYNTTNVYPIDNECCVFVKNIILIDNLTTAVDMPPFIAGYIYIGVYPPPEQLTTTNINSTISYWSDNNSGFYNYTTTYDLGRCCYPSNCYQAKDNPEDCTCIYPIMCGTLEELGIDNKTNYSITKIYDGDWATYPEGIYSNYTKPNSTINWTDDFSDQLEYFGVNNTLKVEYSLEGIEWYVNNKYCDSPNTTLQEGFLGKDIAYCFQINNSCVYDCMWADENITSNKINLVYCSVWISPKEAMWWTEIEEK